MFILYMTTHTMIKLDQQDKKLFGLLISPSWISGLIAVTLGLVFSLGVIIVFSLNTSTVQQQLISWQQDQPERPLTQPGTVVTSDEHPQLKDSWPLLIVWAGVGLIVYMITAAIVHSLSEAEAMRESLGYVNANPKKTLEITVGHIILRLIAAGAFAAMFFIFYKHVIPYSITAAHASASDIQSVTGILYAVLSFLIVALSVQLQTIFLRLAFGRVRLFSGNA